MADTKISALADIVTLAAGDKVPVADASDLTASKSATMTEINTYMRTLPLGTAEITALSAASALADSNVFPVDQAGTIGKATGAQLATLINKATSGVGATPTASSTTAITHGLGRTPTIIRISGKSGFTSNAAATPTTSSEGKWTSSGNACIYQGINGTTTTAAVSSTAFAVFLDTSVNNNISGVIQNVGATTFDIVWTETGTHTRGVYMWEAQ